MGPPLFSGGNRPRHRAALGAEIPASMGPPLFSGGNAWSGWSRGRVNRASMGPPLFSGGNLGAWNN